MSERSAVSCGVKLPLIRPSLEIRPSMVGYDCTRLSRMIARARPILAEVTAANLRDPSAFSVKLTAGRPFSSIDGWAPRRSRPVTAATLRTRKYTVPVSPLFGCAAPVTTSMSGGSTPFRLCSSASRLGAGPASTSFSSRIAVFRMISFARATSVTPGI